MPGLSHCPAALVRLDWLVRPFVRPWARLSARLRVCVLWIFFRRTSRSFCQGVLLSSIPCAIFSRCRNRCARCVVFENVAPPSEVRSSFRASVHPPPHPSAASKCPHAVERARAASSSPLSFMCNPRATASAGPPPACLRRLGSVRVPARAARVARARAGRDFSAGAAARARRLLRAVSRTARARHDRAGARPLPCGVAFRPVSA